MNFADLFGASLRSGYALPACHPENGTPRRQPAELPLIESGKLSRRSRPSLITLAGEIIARAEEQKPRSGKTLKTFKRRAVGVAKVLGRASLRFGIRAASAGLLSGEMIEDGVNAASEIAKAAGDEGAKALDELLMERLESHNADRDAFEQFRVSLTELSDSLATSMADKKNVPARNDGTNQETPPLVFVIDELDRCRPPFALELLEKIEHFFTVPGVIFVLVSSLRQLEGAVRLAYGEIDARTYLEKFYHLRILLPSGTIGRLDLGAATYFRHLAPVPDVSDLSEEIDQFCRVHPLSLRTLERITAYYTVYSVSVPENSIRLSAILAGLCIMKVIEPALYDIARGGKITFEQVSDFLRFGDWKDQYTLDQPSRAGHWAEICWRYALNALLDHEFSDDLNGLKNYLARYRIRSGPEIVSYYCDVIDGFCFNGAR